MIKKIRHILWRIYNSRKSLGDFIKRKIKKITPNKNPQNSYKFAITCVKRTEYVNLLIKNINSLHYINPTHEFTVYCDNKCSNELKRKKIWFDYPKKIKFNAVHSDGDKPWQYYKIETIIDASKKNLISIDADEIWYDDPIIERDKITFLVTSQKISDRPHECLLVEKLFNKNEWTKFNHYNTGFLSIPSHFMTNELANDFRTLFTKLFESDLGFIINKDNSNGIHRISEEIAINLAIQSNYTLDYITTLKNIDGPKNTNIVQSLYYGCSNKIMD